MFVNTLAIAAAVGAVVGALAARLAMELARMDCAHSLAEWPVDHFLHAESRVVDQALPSLSRRETR